MLLYKVLHGGRAADQGLRPGRHDGRRAVVAPWFLFLEGSLDDGPGLVEAEWLDQVVEGAPFHRPHHGLEVAEGRDDDDRCRPDSFAEPCAGP